MKVIYKKESLVKVLAYLILELPKISFKHEFTKWLRVLILLNIYTENYELLFSDDLENEVYQAAKDINSIVDNGLVQHPQIVEYIDFVKKVSSMLIEFSFNDYDRQEVLLMTVQQMIRNLD